MGLDVTWLLVFSAVTVVIVEIVVGSMTLASSTPKSRAAVSLRSAVPLDPEYENVNRVSGWPRQWLEAVCAPPIHQLRDYQRLPNATSTASCRSLTEYAGEGSYLVIARFPSELPMQVDLGNERYPFYVFARESGALIAIATVSRTSVISTRGLGVSPYLQPLERFGFNVYSGPGPP
ncbi:hypothetical protein MARA_22420 [Mycolicibacterium arabiense]|uniref:Uncharacterized protein n=1 Tax=Mycolicibacterium arabiense TaxID=1286181 RepID=A0A7I7RVY6_9MYCO|nr:hypothetical protein MARA_22420 [Mycolicibacterium arabiense]